MTADHKPEHFDEYADKYDAALQESLTLTGESKDYFARRRIEFLKSVLGNPVPPIRSILDFGCGTGSATPHLQAIMGPESIMGVDVSSKSIEVATRTYAAAGARFETLGTIRPWHEFELAFVNGVFHHIPPVQRPDSVRWVFDALKPGGHFAFWENNPWNPGTRWAMSRCAFDDDAITLSPLESRKLLREGGFELVRTDFLFIFPRMLRFLRWMEHPLSRLPIGGQYQVLCRKPG